MIHNGFEVSVRYFCRLFMPMTPLSTFKKFEIRETINSPYLNFVKSYL